MGKTHGKAASEAPLRTTSLPASGRQAPESVAGQPVSKGDASLSELLAHAPVSRFAAELLAKPSVTLFLTESEESEAAFRTLEDAHIRFTAIPRSSLRAPSARWSDEEFNGLARIRDLARVLRAAEYALSAGPNETTPDQFDAADPQLVAWMSRVRERQLTEARGVLAEIRSTRSNQDKVTRQAGHPR